MKHSLFFYIMGTPKQIADVWSRFDMIDAFDEAMSDTKVREEVLDVNREQMRLKGEDSEGKKLRPKYVPATQKRKKRLGSKTTPTPDLYDTGKMQDEMELKKTGRGEYSISSPVEYVRYNYDRYGQFFGIAPKNIGELKLITPAINKSIKKKLKL